MRADPNRAARVGDFRDQLVFQKRPARILNSAHKVTRRPSSRRTAERERPPGREDPPGIVTRRRLADEPLLERNAEELVGEFRLVECLCELIGLTAGRLRNAVR